MPRAKNNASSNDRRDVQGQVAPVNLVWILLEQDENNTTTTSKNVAAHNPIDPASTGSSFMQKSDCSKRHD